MRGIKKHAAKLKKGVVIQTVLLILTFALSFQAIIVFQSSTVHADQFSWLDDTQPTIESHTNTSSLSATCNTIEKEIIGMNDTRNVCVQSYGNFNFATFNYTGSLYKGAVSFGYEKDMYLISDGMCGAYYNECQYIPDKDMMVSRYYFDGPNFKKGFAIFKNFSKKLTQTKNTFGQVTGYIFPLATISPDFVIKDVNSRDYQVSKNGNWIVVELKNRGVFRISTDDFSIKKFTNQHNVYDVGAESSMEFSISDDGTWVAVVGWNIEEHIYKIDDSCGLVVNPNNIIDDSGYEQCPSRDIRDMLGDRTSGLSGIGQPEFSEDGGELRLYLAYYDRTKDEVINLLASGYMPTPQLDYLALGDSYSGGEGDTEVNDNSNTKYYRGWTDVEETQTQPREKCHLSTRSYPYRLATGMGLGNPTDNSLTKWQSVACSGAQTYDINSNGSVRYEGQGKGDALLLWSDGGTPRLKGFSNKDDLKLQALNEFIPGRQKQIEFVKKYRPKVVTLTMGGNDVDFGGKLSSCAVLANFTCDTATEQGRKDLGVIIKRQFEKFANLYSDLQKASPDTKIYVLGYPQIILDRNDVQCSLSTAGLDVDERKVMVAGYWYINQVIKTAANKAGVKYIDISNALVGHRLCESDKPYANGIIAGTGSSDERQESFHPNANGNTAIANAVWDTVGGQSLIDYGDYPTGPNEAINEDNIPVSEYLQTSSSTTTNTQHKNMTSGTLVKTQSENISLEPFSVKPNSTVSVTVHSDLIDIGNFTSNEDGSLNTNIQLPASTPLGYHTLIVTGETYSGEPIEFSQTILVTSSNINDLDGNNIPDNQQPCGPFIEASYIDKDFDGIDDGCDPEIGDTQIYRIRNGNINNGEQTKYMYIERNTRASSVTGIKGDYDPDNDGWAVVAQSTKSSNSGTPAHFWIDSENVPHVSVRTANKGCVQFKPASLKVVKINKVRKFKQEVSNTDTCRSESPSDDVDGDGIPDNQQTLYRAHNGNISKGENPNSIYLERNSVAAEAQLGLSDYFHSNAWNLLSSSQNDVTKANFVKLVMVTDENGRLIPTILANQTKINNKSKTTITCIALQPQNTNVITLNNQDKRLKKVNISEGENCE